MAAGMGETLVTVTNHARSMTAPEVPAPYNTALGRGHRHARLRAEWLCTTFLAMVLNDPKNAAWQVPACGNLPIFNPRLVKHHLQTEGNALNFLGPTTETTFDIPAPSLEPWADKTLFEVLVSIVSSVALDWGGSMHRQLRHGFSVTVNAAPWLYADMREFFEGHADGSMTWRLTTFMTPPAPGAVIEKSAINPIPRQAVILLQHIEILAMLYADTLRHEGVLPPLTPSKTAPAPANAGTETKNASSLPGEPAPFDCQPTTPATTSDDDGTHTRTNGLHKPGSNACVCLSSSASTRTRRRHHAFASHHHTSA